MAKAQIVTAVPITAEVKMNLESVAEGSELFCIFAGDVVRCLYGCPGSEGYSLVLRQDKPEGHQAVTVNNENCFIFELLAVTAAIEYCEAKINSQQRSTNLFIDKCRKLADKEVALKNPKPAHLEYPPDKVFCAYCIHWGRQNADTPDSAGDGVCALLHPGRCFSNFSCPSWEPNMYLSEKEKGSTPVAGKKSMWEAQCCSECAEKGTKDCRPDCSNYR